MKKKTYKPEVKDILSPDIIGPLHNIVLNSRIKGRSIISGIHKSNMPGYNAEFDRHREYVPGDDPRFLDWNAYSRTDQMYIRQYKENSSLTHYICLDISASMEYGKKEHNKLLHACRCAMALTYILLQQQDAVGMILYNDALHVIPAKRRRDYLFELARLLTDITAKGQCSLEQVVNYAVANLKPGMLFILSDFLTEQEPVTDGMKLLHAAGFEPWLIQISHRDEVDLPFDGYYEFRELEVGGKVSLAPHVIRKKYMELRSAFYQHLQSAAHDAGVYYIELVSDEDLTKKLIPLLLSINNFSMM